MGLPNIGPVELIIVLVIALLVLGPGKLPEVGSAFGKTIREFKKASSDITDSTSLTSAPAAPAAPAPAAPVQLRGCSGSQHPDPGHRPQHPVGHVRARPQGHACRPGRRPRLSARLQRPPPRLSGDHGLVRVAER